MKMTSSKRPKRRRQESPVSNSTDSNEEDSGSDEKEYYHKSKGKGKLREDEVQDLQQEEKEEVEPLPRDEEKAVQICGICLTEEEVERGNLDCCDHYFCFGCIMEWAKVESKCPTCKQRFVTIVRPPLPGVARSRPRTFRIPHRDQVYEPSEEEIRLFTDPYQHVVCTECQEAGDERLLLLCDGCDAAAHTYCVGLGRSVPRGDWFCNTCSLIQGQGFSSDDQEHEEEQDHEQETQHVGDNSSRLLNLLAAEAQPIQRRRLPRRAAAPRLNRAVGRHTRLHPAPALSQEAQALISSDPEANLSGSFGGNAEPTPAVARTVSQQRSIHQRVNEMRNNWNQLRSGELQFESISRSSLARPRASQAEQNQTNDRLPEDRLTSAPEVIPSDEISRAWSMMDQARNLRGDRVLPESAPGTRATGHRESAHGWVQARVEGTAVHPPRLSQNHNQNLRREYVREGNRMVESRSRDHRGSRNSGQRDSDRDHDVQARSMRELRISREDIERNLEGRSLPGSSREHERQRALERLGRRPEAERQQAFRPGTRETSRERKEMKEQVANFVKAELRPIYRLGHIDKDQHNHIARLATQELSAAFGLEHRGPETRAFGSLGSSCTHVSSPSTAVLANCCIQCVRHNVHKVVHILLKKNLANGIL